MLVSFMLAPSVSIGGVFYCIFACLFSLFHGNLPFGGGLIMTEQKLIDKLERINSKTIATIERIAKKQENIAVENLIQSLNRLQLNPSGTISSTSGNIESISGLIESYRASIFSPQFVASISAPLYAHYVEVAKLQEQYFLLAEQTFGNTALVRSLQTNALTQTITGLQYAGINTTGLNRVLSTIIADNLTIPQAGVLIKANVPEELTRYANEIVTDSLYQYERNVTKVLTNDLQLEHYYYSGTTRETTRPFCRTRAGRVFTETEVRSWGKMGDWAGKIKGTNEKTIFTFLGGYNCRHRLLPITEERYNELKGNQ